MLILAHFLHHCEHSCTRWSSNRLKRLSVTFSCASIISSHDTASQGSLYYTINFLVWRNIICDDEKCFQAMSKSPFLKIVFFINLFAWNISFSRCFSHTTIYLLYLISLIWKFENILANFVANGFSYKKILLDLKKILLRLKKVVYS